MWNSLNIWQIDNDSYFQFIYVVWGGQVCSAAFYTAANWCNTDCDNSCKKEVESWTEITDCLCSILISYPVKILQYKLICRSDNSSINENQIWQDMSAFVTSCTYWMLLETVRLYHSVLSLPPATAVCSCLLSRRGSSRTSLYWYIPLLSHDWPQTMPPLFYELVYNQTEKWYIKLDGAPPSWTHLA